MARVHLAILSSAIASAAVAVDRAYADSTFQFPSLSSPSPSPSPSRDSSAGAAAAGAGPPQTPPAEETRVRNDNPRTSASGFDPEALERGAKALREINSSSHAKKVASCF